MHHFMQGLLFFYGLCLHNLMPDVSP
jgi:hypothetical protein